MGGVLIDFFGKLKVKNAVPTSENGVQELSLFY